MTYKEQLLDPRWQRKRLHIFERDNWTCCASNCGAKNKNLQIHHKEYLNILAWEYPDDMLVTLCDTCHDKETGREFLEKNFATTLKMRGFLYCDLVAFSSLIDTNKTFRNTILNILRGTQNG